MALIFVLSGMPDPPLPAGTSDTPWHAIGYLGLAVLVCRALAGGFGRPLTASTTLLVVAISVAYALTDEFHQTFVPGRTWAVSDLAADAIGATAGAGACWAWSIISRRLASRNDDESLRPAQRDDL
jgi:VanZ family protein